jgi:hypothetical protein
MPPWFYIKYGGEWHWGAFLAMNYSAQKNVRLADQASGN